MIQKERFVDLKRNFPKLVLLTLSFLFISLIINFYFMIQVPRYHIIYYTELPLEIEREPMVIRFINYILSFFTGDWGNSELNGVPVHESLRSSLPRMIEIMILPLIIGVILGKLLKRVLVYHNRTRNIFKVLGVIGIVTPIFLFGVHLQHIFITILPVNKWEGEIPPLFTGFLILDSIIAGQWELVIQVFVYYIFPTLFLTILTTTLTARKIVVNPTNYTHNDSIISNTLQTGIIFSLIFTYYLLIDRAFFLQGFSYTLLKAIWIPDFFLLQGCMFIIIILLTISIFISNIFFTFKGASKLEISKEIRERNSKEKIITNLKEEATQLKKFFIKRLKSPYSLVGAGIIIFLVIISSFPQLITPFKFSDITYPNFGDNPYEPPSNDHPLGTAHYGYDLLALVIWGIRDLLGSAGWILVIGLLGGIPFGILASKFNRSDKQIVISVMSLFFIFPGVIVTIFMLRITEGDQSVQAFIIGILLIPLFTRKIANTKPKVINIFKELIIYIPGVLVFVNLIYTSSSFLGFTTIITPQLGNIVHEVYGTSLFLERYWVVFWPGLAIGVINIGFVLLFIGLNPRNPKIR